MIAIELVRFVALPSTVDTTYWGRLDYLEKILLKKRGHRRAQHVRVLPPEFLAEFLPLPAPPDSDNISAENLLPGVPE